VKKTLTVTLALALVSVWIQAASDHSPGERAFERHIDGVGGREAAATIRSALVKGTGQEGGRSFAFELRVKAPGLVLFSLGPIGRAAIRMGRDHESRCWRMDGDTVFELGEAQSSQLLSLGLGYNLARQLKMAETLVAAACSEAMEGGRRVSVVNVVAGGEGVSPMVFDSDTGLLVRAGEVSFDRYGEVGTVRMPFRVVPDARTTFEVESILLNEEMDDALFEKPDAGVAKNEGPQPYDTLLSMTGQLQIVRQPATADFGRGALDALPRFDPGAARSWQVDLRGCDVSGLDLDDALTDLLHADFDSKTSWPARMPVGFDPGGIMELGKDPGLRVRQLHARGITGKGIGVGIIDQTLLVDHAEYGDRLRLYEEIHAPAGAPAQMHGPAVASIAVGKRLGVAPGADLYYIAEMHGTFQPGHGFEWDFTPLARSIERLLDLNDTVSIGRRIRVISVSVGWSAGQKGFDEVNAAVERATREGVFVISTAIEATHGLAFHGLGRQAMADPNEFSSFGPGSWWERNFLEGRSRFPAGRRLLVPMDARATASPTGVCDYVYYSAGGWSWSVPWIAGLYALACEVDPGITPERFWAVALETGRTTQIQRGTETLELGTIADPVTLVDRLEAGLGRR
jgi:hypothetical protein